MKFVVKILIFAVLKEQLLQKKEKLKPVLIIFTVLLRKIVSIVYGWQSKVHWANVVIMPYFPAIGQPIAEILQFNGLQMVAVRHLGFLKFDILTGLL